MRCTASGLAKSRSNLTSVDLGNSTVAQVVMQVVEFPSRPNGDFLALIMVVGADGTSTPSRLCCSSVGAPEAEDLLDAGLVEGSPNKHLGQGTANRRFFFESGFLELLWVYDEREAQSTLTAPTNLWDRWAQRGRGANPFGICFSSADGPDSVLAFPSCAYRPDCVSDGRYLLFADYLALSGRERK
jgi:hypothetical protein